MSKRNFTAASSSSNDDNDTSGKKMLIIGEDGELPEDRIIKKTKY